MAGLAVVAPKLLPDGVLLVVGGCLLSEARLIGAGLGDQQVLQAGELAGEFAQDLVAGLDRLCLADSAGGPCGSG